MYYIQKDYITMNYNRQIKLNTNFTIIFGTFYKKGGFMIAYQSWAERFQCFF